MRELIEILFKLCALVWIIIGAIIGLLFLTPAPYTQYFLICLGVGFSILSVLMIGGNEIAGGIIFTLLLSIMIGMQYLTKKLQTLIDIITPTRVYEN